MPHPIEARDQDSLQWPVRYFLVNSSFSLFRDYFHINRKSGQLTQLKPLSRSIVKHLWITVRAEQVNPSSIAHEIPLDLFGSNKYALATVHVLVRPNNQQTPSLTTNSYVGYVYENSQVGSGVFVDRHLKQALQVRLSANEDQSFDATSDDASFADLFDATNSESSLGSAYEIQVSSRLFVVTGSGVLTVAQPDLDRDLPSPSVYTVQLIARPFNQSDTSRSSAPVTVQVHVLDRNDNWPRFAKQTPIQVPAGDTPRIITTVSRHLN